MYLSKFFKGSFIYGAEDICLEKAPITIKPIIPPITTKAITGSIVVNVTEPANPKIKEPTKPILKNAAKLPIVI